MKNLRWPSPAGKAAHVARIVEIPRPTHHDDDGAGHGLPITIRLLDPPLHEFVPHSQDKPEALAKELKVDMGELDKRAEGLRENDPMLGHCGVRLGVTYPEITEMRVRAILEAAGELLGFESSARRVAGRLSCG